jgi:cytochrome P450
MRGKRFFDTNTLIYAVADYPVSGLDPFSEAYLADLHPAQEALREAGPVVRLTHYNVWAVARYQEVYDVLNDWRTYSSARGAGLSDFKKEKPWACQAWCGRPIHRCTTALARCWTTCYRLRRCAARA